MSLSQTVHTPLYTNLGALLRLRYQAAKVPLFARSSRASSLLGQHKGRLRGRGIDFDQVRVYQPGDDVRTIDWRVTARAQEPHTKLFHEERERPVILVVEQSMQLFFGSGVALKSVIAAEAASLLGWVALAHNDRVGGLVFGDQAHYEVRPKRSKHNLVQLLNSIVQANHTLNAHMPETSGQELSIALHRARQVARPGSLLILLCDERSLDVQAQEQLGLLARHIELILLPLSDHLEQALPTAGWLSFTQGSAALRLDSDDRWVRQRYAEQALARRANWQRIAQKYKALLLPLGTQASAFEQLCSQLHAGVATA